MRNSLVSKGKILAIKTLLLQLFVSLILSLFFVIFFTSHLAVSFAIGAAISVIPNLVFSFFAFRFAGATKKDLVMKSFSQGSKIKLAMTMILFVLAYQLPQLHPVTMLIGFVLTTATHTISIIWISKRHSTISN